MLPRSLFASRTVALALTLGFAAGCSGGSGPLGLFGKDDPPAQPKPDDKRCSGESVSDNLGDEPGGIHAFATEQDLDAYLASIEALQPKPCRGGSSTDDESQSAGAAPADSAGEPSNSTITNNQEASVDEGGIIKNIGSSLLVLRQGRLYAVDVSDSKAPSLTDSIRVARTESLNGGVWYDEMLVKGDLVYVIGYRYSVPTAGEQARGATEVDTFRFAGGKLTRIKSMFLESNDYYSTKNYTSRMVDGKLVFYMPHYLWRDQGKLTYPRVLEANDAGVFTSVGPIFGALDVKTSLQKPLYPTFHTIVQCELPDTGELACHGRSVIGSAWGQRYVSPSAVYLWAGDDVYRFDFASLAIAAHGTTSASGPAYPLDQFAFKETDTDLLVAVNTGRDAVQAELLSLPLAGFDATGGQPAPSTVLGDKQLTQNRFVGDVLVAALSTWTYNGDAVASEVVTFDPETKAIARAPASDYVVRIEPIGDRRALLVRTNDLYGSSASSHLELATVSVDAPQTKLGAVTLAGVGQGEGRSHGFFYKPGTAGAGTFGYAIVAPPGSAAPQGWGNGISNLGFFDVAASGAIAPLGIIASGSDVSQCETSCTDWYGNTRPVFLGSRVFALMASELAEVTLRPSAEKLGAPVELTFAP